MDIRGQQRYVCFRADLSSVWTDDDTVFTFDLACAVGAYLLEMDEVLRGLLTWFGAWYGRSGAKHWLDWSEEKITVSSHADTSTVCGS